MLDQRLYDMNITQLIAEQSIIKSQKYDGLAELDVEDHKILAILDQDLELKEIADLILDKTIANRAKAYVSRGILNEA